MTDRGVSRALLAGAFCIGLWTAITLAFHVVFGTGIYLARLLFLTQDLPVLFVGTAALAGIAMMRAGGASPVTPPSPRAVGLAVLAFAIVAWAGRYIIFSDYALSRDEQMAEFAGAYLSHGHLGLPIPGEWQPYGRAIVPIFFSSFGSDHIWSSVYLPGAAAIRAVFGWLGDPALASPAMTAIGLWSLYDIARRLFAERPDCVWVVMLMAFGSTQLLAMAMTPYAMPSHFGLDMLWLALVVRGTRKAHLGAAVALFVASGLHQWHFASLFVLPFLLWLALGRRWGPLLFQSGVLIAAILFWVKVWPHILVHFNGVAPPAAPMPAAGLGSRLTRLVARLADVQPLFSMARFVAWNDILLLPLGACALPTLWRRWRDVLRGREPVLPLLLVVMLGMGLMLYQKHGWGYRYLHAGIGPACLLAGYGWQRLSGTSGRLSLRPIWASVLVSAGVAGFLLMQAHQFVSPYAQAWRMVRDSRADVAIVDWRGILYGQDLVRIKDGKLTKPVSMDIYFMTQASVDALCARRGMNIVMFDRRDFWPLGITRTQFMANPDDHAQRLRDHMDAIGCGRRVFAR